MRKTTVRMEASRASCSARRSEGLVVGGQLLLVLRFHAWSGLRL